MKYKIACLIVGFAPLVSSADIDLSRCLADLPGEAHVYSSDFKWGMSLDEIKNAANVMYNSEKRLSRRAYYNEEKKSLIFPHIQIQGGDVRVPESFIKTIQKHVEKAFQRRYIDAVLFPDMGHSHFLVPNEDYQRDIAGLPVDDLNFAYERVFINKNLKIVYHTAEQLSMLEDDRKTLLSDKKVQWRYYTRNLIGHNNENPDLEVYNATATSAANTMGEVNGYHWWGAGFNIHANKNGCFSFVHNGETKYFDLSLYDLEMDPSLGGVD